MRGVKIFRKLIRDKMPEHFEKEGKRVKLRVIDNDREFESALLNKLVEEVQEMRRGDDPKRQIAYFYEILDTLAGLYQFSKEDIIGERRKQKDERGGFTKRLFLEGEE